MPKPTLNDIVDSYRSDCCNDEAVAKNKDIIICNTCKADVTNEWFYHINKKT